MKIFFIILTKELTNFMRSSLLVVVVLYAFTADIYVAGSGIEIKPKNVAIGYVDATGGGIAQKILSKLHKPEFVTPRLFLSQKALSKAIFNKKILVGIIFDSDFEKNYREGKVAKLNILLDYAKSNNLWEKRISIVATFVFIKNNQFIPTLEIAKTLLNDKHDLIHKAIGWMLREIYKKDTETCSNFLRENYAQLPRTTLRYAIERMPEDERLRYLKGEF